MSIAVWRTPAVGRQRHPLRSVGEGQPMFLPSILPGVSPKGVRGKDTPRGDTMATSEHEPSTAAASTPFLKPLPASPRT
eukprot:365043-Chlamydomonas_euryale.AAC.17